MTTRHDVTTWTVGRVAERFGITRRTLHHYDEIGLVRPSGRSGVGYRLYDESDLARLTSVVVYRRLGFSLSEVGALIDAPDSVEEHLRRQRSAVMTRLDELSGLVEAIDNALEEIMSDRPITTTEMKELFGESWSEDYDAEARERWGDTDQRRQSQERTTHFTTADWQRVKAENDAIDTAFIEVFTAGEPARSSRAMDVAERHRLAVETHYDCSHDVHITLAQMYLADPRFTAYFEKQRTGLAQYVHDAILANAARQG